MLTIYYEIFLYYNLKNCISSIYQSHTYTSAFDQIGNHNDYRYALFPNHPPKAIERRWKWTLGTDVCSRLLPPVDVIRVNIILTLFRRSTTAGE